MITNQLNADLARNAGKFLSSLQGRGWVSDWRCVVNGEGGLKSLHYNCMMWGLETDPNWKQGFVDYGRMLVKEYGHNRMSNNVLSLAEFDEYMLPYATLTGQLAYGSAELEYISEEEIDETLVVAFASELPPMEGIHLLNAEFQGTIRNPEEEYFMYSYAKTASIRESAELCGIPYADGLKIFKRVKERAAVLERNV